MAASNSVNANQTGIQTFTGTAFTGSTVTQHGVLVGDASNAVTSTGVGSTGQVLQGVTSGNPTYSTATYPSVATGTGTILRADGTNWVATTSTYPNTNAINTLLYASSANVMSALPTANSGVLTTDASGVPSIDTTNFVRQTTGMQMKGNNTNTAPPSGFIGEQIRSSVASPGSSITNNNTVNVTSINLTAGIWDVSAIGAAVFAGANGTYVQVSVTTSSAAVGARGDNNCVITGGNFTELSGVVPAYRFTLSTTTTVYLTMNVGFPSSTATAYGTIRGTRVG